jgi:prefoldin subunit 5
MEDEEGRRRREEFARLARDPNYFRAEAEALEHDLLPPASPTSPGVQELWQEVQRLRAEVQELRDEVRQLRARLM